MSAPYLRAREGGVEIQVVVRPRASRHRIAGPMGDRLKIQIAAPPVDGQANAALVAFLADALGVRRADVTIASGQSGTRKTVLVSGIDEALATQRLGARS